MVQQLIYHKKEKSENGKQELVWRRIMSCERSNGHINRSRKGKELGR
jgi:hypothetical protein